MFLNIMCHKSSFPHQQNICWLHAEKLARNIHVQLIIVAMDWRVFEYIQFLELWISLEKFISHLAV